MSGMGWVSLVGPGGVVVSHESAGDVGAFVTGFAGAAVEPVGTGSFAAGVRAFAEPVFGCAGTRFVEREFLVGCCHGREFLFESQAA